MTDISFNNYVRGLTHARTIECGFAVFCEECGAAIKSHVVGEFPTEFSIKIEPHTCATGEAE